MTITLEHTENIGAVQPGVPHNTYYPGDGARMTKNGGKGGIGKNPAGAHVATTCGMIDSNSGGAPGSAATASDPYSAPVLASAPPE